MRSSLLNPLRAKWVGCLILSFIMHLGLVCLNHFMSQDVIRPVNMLCVGSAQP